MILQLENIRIMYRGHSYPDIFRKSTLKEMIVRGKVYMENSIHK